MGNTSSRTLPGGRPGRHRRRLPVDSRRHPGAPGRRRRGGRGTGARSARRCAESGGGNGRGIGARPGQGHPGDARAATSASRRSEGHDRAGHVGSAGGERRRGHAHRRRPGLPRQPTSRLRLRRRRPSVQPTVCRTAPAGLPRLALVPRRPRPHPPRLAQLPPQLGWPLLERSGRASDPETCQPTTPPSYGPESPRSRGRSSWTP